MGTSDVAAGGYRAELRAAVGLVVWTFAWVASLALARLGPGMWGEERSAATWVSVVVNLVIGVGWVVAITHYLRVLDELQRKIVQDALVVALGFGWVVGFGYVVAEAAGLVDVEVAAGALPALMGIVFMVTFAYGKLRYR